MMDAFTTSDNYPYSRHYRLGRTPVNYIRNSVKVVVNAYDGTTSFYVFDAADPMIAAYRAIFPTLFKDASAMPADLRKHVRYPELLLELQAAVYGLYHMTNPEAFYNREDLWTVASEVRGNNREQAAQPIEPNFVLMTLPGETGVEFVEILPFTPANRNNLIGWIAGRSDGEHYGTPGRLQLPEEQARRRTAAGRGAHRSELAAVGPVLAVESAGLARRARRPARHSDRHGPALRGADLPAGRTQSDARAASRRARPAGSARLRHDVRSRDGRAVRQRSLAGHGGCHAAAGARPQAAPGAATSPPPISRRSSATPPAISPNISG